VGDSFNPGEVTPGFNHYEIAETRERDRSYFDLQTANRACGLLGELAPRGPFALFVGFHSPHEPYVMPKKYLDTVADIDIQLPEVLPDEYETKCQSFKNRVDFLEERFGPIDEEKTKTGIRGYLGLMTMIDECVSKVLNTIDSLGLLKDTIIIFTSDHGDVLGEHGIFNKTATFYEGEVRIPFFIRVPGGEHRSVTGFGSNIDFVPTLFDLLEMEPDLSLPGHSLKSMLEGYPSPRDHVLSSIGPAMMIRTDRWKLWLDSRFDDGELYDLGTDSKEQRNLFKNPAYADTRRELTERLALERIRSDVRNNKATERDWNISLEVAVTGEPEVGYGGR
jgi:choline-sulfatase